MAIQDKYGRKFETLRVSLTNACNFNCSYCVAADAQIAKPHNTITTPLSAEKLLEIIISINLINPLKTIRITGGEPTLYKELILFVKGLHANHFKDIRMTTNGYLLKDKIQPLINAGLSHLNVSLDGLNEQSFHAISTHGKLEPVLEVLNYLKNTSIPVKLNTVILKNKNDNQILPLLQYAKENNFIIRFLELMRMGPMHDQKEFEANFFSENEILRKINSEYSITSLETKKSSTAKYWKTTNGIIFGIIANESSPFCHDCNRLRLDSYGNIYGCLSNDHEIPIQGIYENQSILKKKLEEALAQKQELKFTGSPLSMMAIGG